MGGELFGIFCTADISAETLDDLLSKAYSHPSSTSTSPTLCILTHPTLHLYPPTSPSQPPTPPFTSPFLNHPIPALASLLAENAETTAINARYFLIADSRSAADQSVLLVKVKRGDEIESLRIGFGQANGLVCALGVGARGWAEVRDYVGADGVYRGDPPPPSGGGGGPREGEEAPRKRLP